MKKKKKKKRIILAGCLILFILSTITLININLYKKVDKTFKTLDDITITWGRKVNLMQNMNIYFFKNIDLNQYMIIEENYDNKVGKYDIKYKLKFGFYENETTKKLIIEESENPIIILNGDTVTLYEGEFYKEPGFIAYDNYDGDITDKVLVSNNINYQKSGTYNVYYNVIDSSNNKAEEVSRKVIIKKKETEKQMIKFSNTRPTSINVDKYINELNEYLKSYNVSIGYYNLNNNFTYLYNENKLYFGASLIKTVDAMYIYENMKLNDTLKEKVKLAITKSDNDAHAYLVKKIGKDKLKEYGNSLGATNTLTCDNNFCNTTVIDQLNYLRHLYNMIIKDDELKNYFINDYGNYLSYDYSFCNLHKYGNSGKYFHDVGIFLGDNPYIIVVLTQEKSQGEAYVAQLIRDISQRINNLNSMVN